MNKVFKALNDPIRREILNLLREKDLTAGEIADNFNISAPSISHHLDKLKQADLVSTVKKGQYVHYSLNTSIFDELIQFFIAFKPKKDE
jgi:DNA-binding transcriptional ArsR family regulator